ncbi:DMT family transporter [Aurantiacibacter poecillastricola]|uniref:DMT family transporter n=1 Tax=Aurantiacibacter poecillastricola TaxID=3064385 RepID=UPI00273E4CAC|nr:DMT family transporter [Aurantiacibacter sp. 219JJ12-13]MDP5262594.1 DMT family transporter [Aurantiacibacter sp. 219JJ12-13]
MQETDRSGLLFALAGFCTLTLGDAIVKGIDGAWAPTAIAAWRYGLGAVGLTAILIWKEGLAPLRNIPGFWMQWLRGAGVGVATICFFASVWLMPLTEAIALAFTQPMFTAILAAIFLGEKLRWQTVAATLLAFAGVLIVLRPNFAEIGIAALLPLGAAMGMAVLVTANRAVAGRGSALAMQSYVALFATVILVIAMVIGHASGMAELQVQWPAWHIPARVAIIAVTASTAHWLIYMGTERAGAATVAPMTYGQLIAASVLGYLFFSEVPDLTAMAGAALIILAGLWLWHDGRTRRGARMPA